MIDYFEMISALTADYLNVYLITPRLDNGIIVKLEGYVIDGIKDAEEIFSYSKFLHTYARDRVCDEDRNKFLELLSPEALLNYFTCNIKNFELNYRVLIKGELHHFSGLYTRISSPGEELRLVAGFRNIDATVFMQKQIHNKGRDHAYEAISSIYLSMHIVNVRTNTYYSIKTTEPISKCVLPNSNRFDTNAQRVVRALVTEESHSSALKFLDINTLESRMHDKVHISTPIEIKYAGSCRLHFIREDSNIDKPLEYVVCAVEVLDENDYRSVFEPLTRSFQNVYLINLRNGTAKILKMEGYVTKGLDKNNARYFSYPKILKEYISERVHPDDKKSLYNEICMENLRKVFSTHDEYIGNYRILLKDETHNYQYNFSKVAESDSIVCGFQNIDAIVAEHIAEEKKQAEQNAKLNAAIQAADCANNAKTEFLLRMSHDLRTPINGIIGMLNIAEQSSNDTDKQTECLNKIKNSAKILLEIVNEILDISKLESGKIVLEHIPFDLNELSRDVYNTVTVQAQEKGIEIIQKDCIIHHSRLLGSPSHLKRLIMNILGNAIKYNKEHGKIFVTFREISSDEKTVQLEFKCQDTGIGMDSDFLEIIFDPFTQESISARTKYGGTGLGMSITKRLIDAMGGTITVESEKGKGTCFDVLLSLDTNTLLNPQEAATSPLDTLPSIKNRNILLVEDNELNMEIVTFLLEKEGVNLTLAWNGKDALDKFKTSACGSFDAILMDIMMPVMDGYDATRSIRSLDRPDAKTVPIIAMTANAFTEDKIKSRTAGMNGHISKPLDPMLLVSTIARLINN